MPFQARHTRAPAVPGKEQWDTCFVIARVAAQFRDLEPAEVESSLAELISDMGVGTVARMLEDNTSAISMLRGVLASLMEADRRMAVAARTLGTDT
ncbi:MAG: hypothetical protein P4L76_05330 [Beijerinckiaceae bacterium]|nr:hypothetical protein [Beijerinckiaceae bacterium]